MSVVDSRIGFRSPKIEVGYMPLNAEDKKPSAYVRVAKMVNNVVVKVKGSPVKSLATRVRNDH